MRIRIEQSNAAGCIRSAVQPARVKFTLQVRVGHGHRSSWHNFLGVWGEGEGGKDWPSTLHWFLPPTDSQGNQSRWPSHSGFQSDIHKVEFLPLHLWYKPCGAYGKKGSLIPGFVGKPQVQRSLGSISIDGRKLLKCFLDNVTGWIWLRIGRSGEALTNTVRNCRVPKSTGNFLTNGETLISFSRTTLFQEVLPAVLHCIVLSWGSEIA